MEKKDDKEQMAPEQMTPEQPESQALPPREETEGGPVPRTSDPIEVGAEDRAAAEASLAENLPVESIAVENVTGGAGDSPSPTERMASTARSQASAAADAFRRGEFMRDAAVDPEADSDDRLIGLLCYVTQIVIPLVMPVLVLMSESSKKRPFQRFHAVQSLALVSLFVLLSLLVTIGTAIVSIIPVIGWVIGLTVLCLSPIAVLMGYFAVGYYGFQAYQGKRFGIPGLTSFLKDQGWL